MTASLLDRWDVAELHELIDLATDAERAVIVAALEDELYDWEGQIARPKQLEPEGDWLYWVLMTGRGFGKTRTGSQWLRKRALGTVGEYGIIAPTIAKVRDVCIESGFGESWRRRSGFRSVCRPGEIVNYNRSQFEIDLVNGSKIKGLSAEVPGDSEGWNFTAVWCDEFSSWPRPDAWFRTLLPAVRIADRHRFVITTTPKRNELTRWILKRGEEDPDRVRVVRGSTWENEANLGADVVEELRRSMSARLARQELDGELLDDVEGALWRSEWFLHIDEPDLPAETPIVVAIDPAVTSGEDSDETGIVVAGRYKGSHRGFVLEDISGRYDPSEAMRTAIDAFRYYKASKIVVERNNGGDYLPALARTIDPSIRIETVVASRSKTTRAEPIATKYEHGDIDHIDTDGDLAALEDQLTTWVRGEKSPDRLDALVWAFTSLFPELDDGPARKLHYR